MAHIVAILPTSNSACLASCSHSSVPMTPVLISSDQIGLSSPAIRRAEFTKAILEISVNSSFYLVHA